MSASPAMLQEHGAPQAPAADGHSGPFDLGEMLAHHILNSSEYELPFIGEVHLPHWDPVRIGGLAVDMSPSKHVVLLLLAAVITAAMTLFAARTVARQGTRRAPRGLANAVEAVVVFLRDDLCKEFIGKGYERFVPLILTQFFFILTMNLLGLVPWGGAASGNLAVTAMLALITFVVVEVSGFRTLGPAGYMRTIFFSPPGTTGAVKYLMLAIMTPVELLGKLTKPFALAIRLFANMTAGHMMIFTLVGFIFIFGHIAFGRWVVAAGSYAFVSAILLLELLIAFIQAYIFAMLSAVFIGLMRHEH
ncbi:MAG: F0F1 ATP synthase subunit A [Gemmatimonadetes bacterium]|nr:F0F1 ATP synthase subunit A [Gemmatimonadota bacterium]